MHAKDLRKWRRDLGFTQEEAGRALGVSRITIQNWESGSTPVPLMAEGACERATRRWKQRANYGPVTLVYFGAPLGQLSGEGHVERFASNDAALGRVRQLWNSPSFNSPTIIDDQTGFSIWHYRELEREIERRGARAPTKAEREKVLRTIRKISRHYMSLPLLDDRSADEIIGYDEHGLPS